LKETAASADLPEVFTALEEQPQPFSVPHDCGPSPLALISGLSFLEFHTRHSAHPDVFVKVNRTFNLKGCILFSLLFRKIHI
jgi:hypothetical protein